MAYNEKVINELRINQIALFDLFIDDSYNNLNDQNTVNECNALCAEMLTVRNRYASNYRLELRDARDVFKDLPPKSISIVDDPKPQSPESFKELTIEEHRALEEKREAEFIDGMYSKFNTLDYDYILSSLTDVQISKVAAKAGLLVDDEKSLIVTPELVKSIQLAITEKALTKEQVQAHVNSAVSNMTEDDIKQRANELSSTIASLKQQSSITKNDNKRKTIAKTIAKLDAELSALQNILA